MAVHAKACLILMLTLLVLYFLLPALLLRFAIDRLTFAAQTNDSTHEDQRYEVNVGGHRSVVVRRYGPANAACVIFFPGQHGSMGTYERRLFPQIRSTGAVVYALSYPGQDGATGTSQLRWLADDVAAAIHFVEHSSPCTPARSVFVGRSLGATVALAEAARFSPRGVLLDGVSPDLSGVVHAWFARHPLATGWNMLPVRTLLADDFALTDILAKLPGTPVVVFQGTADQVTPYEPMRIWASANPSIRFIPVRGASHEDAYLLGRACYIESLKGLLKGTGAANRSPD
jgi:alpha-beta hydrolase superfamily lysophospholipase